MDPRLQAVIDFIKAHQPLDTKTYTMALALVRRDFADWGNSWVVTTEDAKRILLGLGIEPPPLAPEPPATPTLIGETPPADTGSALPTPEEEAERFTFGVNVRRNRFLGQPSQMSLQEFWDSIADIEAGENPFRHIRSLDDLSSTHGEALINYWGEWAGYNDQREDAKRLLALREREVTTLESQAKAGMAEAEGRLDIARQELELARDRAEAADSQFLQQITVRRQEMRQQYALASRGLNLQEQELELSRTLGEGDLALRRELGLGDLGLAREEFAFQREQAPIERQFERELIGADIGQRQREAELGAQIAGFQGAIQNPFAFAALQALIGQEATREGQQAAVGEFAEAQRLFQEQTQARGAGAEELEQLRAALAGERGLGVFQASPDFFQGLLDKRAALQALLAQPEPTVPTLQEFPQRVPTQFEQQLQQLGFALPTGVGPSTELGTQEFFRGGTPTIGALGQVTPESQQFLRSVLGFQGVSPGSFLQESRAITPTTVGAPKAKILPQQARTGR